MRIGEFAKKYGVTQDTIRHYLDMDLLVAKKKGSQYFFDEDNCRDLEDIRELKEVGFSLAEIKEIMTYKRISGKKTNDYRNRYRGFLEKKIKDIDYQQKTLEKVSFYLNQKVNELEEESSLRAAGLPLELARYFCCPDCGCYLDISDGEIKQSMIMEGAIQCSCNYHAVIERGIYVEPAFVRKKTLNGRKMPTKEEYAQKTPPKYINFIYQGLQELVKKVASYQKNNSYILELGTCVGFFLMNYWEHLPQNCTYILNDYDRDRIMDQKQNLEMQEDQKANFAFFCCDMDRLPFKDAIMDLIVDFWASRHFAEIKNKFLPDIVQPLLRQEGYLAGVYPHFGTLRGLHSMPEKVRDYYDKDKVLGYLENTLLEQVDVEKIGPVDEGGFFNPHVNGNEYYQMIYVGCKKAIKMAYRNKKVTA